jgi:hypothetical protein
MGMKYLRLGEYMRSRMHYGTPCLVVLVLGVAKDPAKNLVPALLAAVVLFFGLLALLALMWGASKVLAENGGKIGRKLAGLR